MNDKETEVEKLQKLLDDVRDEPDTPVKDAWQKYVNARIEVARSKRETGG